jgi:quinol monooxygenase YgiN
MEQLRIGAALERVLGYLRTLLPSETGYITARAMYSVDRDDRTHLVFQSVWETWEDLEAHRESELAEDKVLTEFEPHVELNDLVVHVYEEVA